MMDRKSPRALLSEVVRQKEQRRRIAAQRSFGEKIAIVEKLRSELQPLKATRTLRHTAKTS